MKVYVAQEVGSRWIKVGKTNSIRRRFQDLQTGNPRRLKVIAEFKCDRSDLGRVNPRYKGMKIKVPENLIRDYLDQYAVDSFGEWLLIRKGYDIPDLAQEAVDEAQANEEVTKTFIGLMG